MTTSSIQYLKDKFITIQYLLKRDEITDSQADFILQNAYQKANEMHKEEIVDAYMKGFDNYKEDCYLPASHTSENYYNNTFKNDGDCIKTIGTKSNFYEVAKKINVLNQDNSLTTDGFRLTLKEIGVYRSNVDLSMSYITIWFEDELCVFKRNEYGNWHDVSTLDNKQTL